MVKSGVAFFLVTIFEKKEPQTLYNGKTNVPRHVSDRYLHEQKLLENIST